MATPKKFWQVDLRLYVEDHKRKGGSNPETRRPLDVRNALEAVLERSTAVEAMNDALCAGDLEVKATKVQQVRGAQNDDELHSGTEVRCPRCKFEGVLLNWFLHWPGSDKSSLVCPSCGVGGIKWIRVSRTSCTAWDSMQKPYRRSKWDALEKWGLSVGEKPRWKNDGTSWDE